MKNYFETKNEIPDEEYVRLIRQNQRECYNELYLRCINYGECIFNVMKTSYIQMKYCNFDQNQVYDIVFETFNFAISKFEPGSCLFKTYFSTLFERILKRKIISTTENPLSKSLSYDENQCDASRLSFKDIIESHECLDSTILCGELYKFKKLDQYNAKGRTNKRLKRIVQMSFENQSVTQISKKIGISETAIRKLMKTKQFKDLEHYCLGIFN